MTKNPFVNAIAAALYIIVVALGMDYSRHFAPDFQTVLVPMAILSLFVFSAAVMGFLFLYQPVQMFLEGDKKGGSGLFLKTLATFGVLTAAFLLTLLYVASKF